MTTFRVDVRGLTGLADRLGRLDGRRLGIVAVDTVNQVAVQVETEGVKGGLKNINLSESYFRGKMTRVPATGRPRAEIIAAYSGTVLGRFGGTEWYRQPGAPRRAGPVKGRRSAGVYTNITNTDRQDEPQWFLMRLRNQGGLMGAFVRTTALKGKGKNDYGKGLGDVGRRRDGKYGKKHVYGPSPHQLFSRQIDVQSGQWVTDLGTAATRNLLAEIERVVL